MTSPVEYCIEHQQQRYELCHMQHSDIEALLLIEASVHSHPWTRGHFISSLESSHQCWVLKCTDDIVAYAITSTAAGEAELLNIAVALNEQRKGLGRQLLSRITSTFDDSIHTVFLEVRASNDAAIALYHSLHFNEVGIRPRYYPSSQGREDAIIMALSLSM